MTVVVAAGCGVRLCMCVCVADPVDEYAKLGIVVPAGDGTTVDTLPRRIVADGRVSGRRDGGGGERGSWGRGTDGTVAKSMSGGRVAW